MTIDRPCSVKDKGFSHGGDRLLIGPFTEANDTDDKTGRAGIRLHTGLLAIIMKCLNMAGEINIQNKIYVVNKGSRDAWLARHHSDPKREDLTIEQAIDNICAQKEAEQKEEIEKQEQDRESVADTEYYAMAKTGEGKEFESIRDLPLSPFAQRRLQAVQTSLTPLNISKQPLYAVVTKQQAKRWRDAANKGDTECWFSFIRNHLRKEMVGHGLSVFFKKENAEEWVGKNYNNQLMEIVECEWRGPEVNLIKDKEANENLAQFIDAVHHDIFQATLKRDDKGDSIESRYQKADNEAEKESGKESDKYEGLLRKIRNYITDKVVTQKLNLIISPHLGASLIVSPTNDASKGELRVYKSKHLHLKKPQ